MGSYGARRKHVRTACRRGCGMTSYPPAVAKHERSCWTPATLERLYEIGRVDTSGEGCWEWQALDGGTFDWYPRIRQTKVSHLVAALVHGAQSSPALRPLHSCDNKRCVRGDHLRWGTQAENVQDLYDHGRR